MQDFNHARLTKEAKAPDVKTNSKNTIIVDIPKGSPIKGKSRTIYTDLTSRTNFTNRKKGEN